MKNIAREITNAQKIENKDTFKADVFVKAGRNPTNFGRILNR